MLHEVSRYKLHVLTEFIMSWQEIDNPLEFSEAGKGAISSFSVNERCFIRKLHNVERCMALLSLVSLLAQLMTT
jgi:hypothetical protein